MHAQRGMGSRAVAWARFICIAVTAVGTWTSPGRAADVNVGSITLTRYDQIGPAGGGGGVSARATQMVNLANTCLAGATVHWMQLATLSTPAGPVLPPGFVGPPQPNLGVPGFANFNTAIDPIPGQPISMGQTGNATPFYDITANTAAQLLNQANWLRQGTGVAWGDDPRIPFNLLNAGNTPFTVTFQTILVATTVAKPNTLLELGGFQWGFTLNINANRVTLQNPTALAFANLNPGWQGALDSFFASADPYTLARATCPNGDPVVSFVSVPEPSTIVMAVIGIPGMMIVSSRHRRRRVA